MVALCLNSGVCHYISLVSLSLKCSMAGSSWTGTSVWYGRHRHQHTVLAQHVVWLHKLIIGNSKCSITTLSVASFIVVTAFWWHSAGDQEGEEYADV